ncbi:MAG TPA: hypothetical protein PLX89_14185 [Verrucomicrobiota bacterium]|nr:hypothetical protein [Verrucomicrobiota bacterium]
MALLTNDRSRAAAEIVRLMFGRWVQENDFKYLDQHFGINQITSYQSIDYAQLKAALTDRQGRRAARQALDQQLHQANEILKRHLLAEEQALQAH